MKEYAFEHGKRVDLKTLINDNIPQELFAEYHKNCVIATHDVAINYNGLILLVKRNNYPEFGEWWPIGGRIRKGIAIEESLKLKTKKECGLELININFLGSGRCFFHTDPFNHGYGTDTIGFMFYAIGKGHILLDNLHADYKLVSPQEYKSLRKYLHPYVKEINDKAIKIMRR